MEATKEKHATFTPGHHINEIEIYELALHQLKLKAGRLARKGTKSSFDELNFINAQRKDIAVQLYHTHRLQKDELYLAAYATKVDGGEG